MCFLCKLLWPVIVYVCLMLTIVASFCLYVPFLSYSGKLLSMCALCELLWPVIVYVCLMWIIEVNYCLYVPYVNYYG